MTWRGGWAVVDDEGAGEGDECARAHHEVAGLTWVLPISRLVCVRACNDVAVVAAHRHWCRISLAWLKVSNWGEGVGNGLGNSQKVLRGRSGSGGCGDGKTNGASWSTTGGWWCCCTEVHYRRLGNVVVAVISVVGGNLPCLVKK